MRNKLAAVLLALSASASAAWGAEGMTRSTYHERCAGCHEHVFDLAERHLTLTDQTLVGKKTGRDIGEFLLGHEGGVDREQAAVLVAMLKRQLSGGGRFHRQCAECHDSARKLARNLILTKDGRLRGRYTGQDAIAWLLDHARIDAEEAVFFGGLLAEMAAKQGQ